MSKLFGTAIFCRNHNFSCAKGQNIIQDRAPKDYDRVLYENFDSIKEELIELIPNFYELPYKKQKELVKLAVDKKIEDIKFREQTAIPPIDLGGV